MKKQYKNYDYHIEEFKKLRGRIRIRLAASTLILLDHGYNDSYIVPVHNRQISVSGNYREFNINAEEYRFLTNSSNSGGKEMFDIEVIRPFI